MTNERAVAIVGATACGKSELAMMLAEKLNGEIVCMDSMQIYRRMDIGTAKPTEADRALVPHYMLDIVEPTDTYTVAQYAEETRAVLCGIRARGKVPILVGGTGLYLRALMHGMPLGGAGSDEALREELHAIADEPGGKEKLHRILDEVDPSSAAKLHINDIRRVIRAIEVFKLTGKPLSEQAAHTDGQTADILPLGLLMPRPLLYERIEKRVRRMLDDGLLNEVEALLKSGVTDDAQSMQGIGYKELVSVVRHGAPLEEAARQVILNTRHYAKRQGAFFRTEPDIEWLETQNDALLQTAYEKSARYMDAR